MRRDIPYRRYHPGFILLGVTDSAFLLSQLSIVAVLIVSGLAKWGEAASTREVMSSLRLPDVIARDWAAKALPLAEIALALCLVIPWQPLGIMAAAAAIVLFCAYWVIIARALSFHPRPSCGCFGRIGDQRISWRTFFRNTLLVALAVVGFIGYLQLGSLWHGLMSGGFATALVWLASLIVVMLIIGIDVPDQASETPTDPMAGPSSAMPTPRPDAHRARAEGAPADPTQADGAAPTGDPDNAVQSGTADNEALDYLRIPTPYAVLLTMDGSPTELVSLTARQPVMIIMANCFCHSTTVAAQQLDHWRSMLPEVDIRMIFSTKVRPDPSHGFPDYLYDYDGALWRTLQVPYSPAAVLLGADRQLAGGPVSGNDEIQAFVADIRAELDEAVIEAEQANDPA